MPTVDSRQDNGHFLFELVPAMRERLRNATGVWIPGVRARGNPNFSPGCTPLPSTRYPCSQARWTSASAGTGPALDEAGVPNDLAEPALAEVDEIDPLTGTQGRFLVEHTLDGSATDTIPPARYLTHRLEMVLRGRLSALLGVKELTALLDRWVPSSRTSWAAPSSGSGDRAAHRTDAGPRRRADPVRNWRAILDTVVAGDGLDTPLGDLHRRCGCGCGPPCRPRSGQRAQGPTGAPGRPVR